MRICLKHFNSMFFPFSLENSHPTENSFILLLWVCFLYPNWINSSILLLWVCFLYPNWINSFILLLWVCFQYPNWINSFILLLWVCFLYPNWINSFILLLWVCFLYPNWNVREDLACLLTSTNSTKSAAVWWPVN